MSTEHATVIQRALLSVSDKAGIIDFANSLHQLGVEILSTGGTYKLLISAGIPAIEIASYTGFAEIMDGRVKTLHHKIHGGILARRGEDAQVMAEHDIPPIDLVVVNLYPFEETVAERNCKLETAIENIDIGGPTLLRAAAKNHRHVGVIVNSTGYSAVIDELKTHDNCLSDKTRFNLAVQAFEHTAHYDGAIANYLGALIESAKTKNTTEENNTDPSVFPRTFNSQFIKAQNMRYGENPHQQAAFYIEKDVQEASIASAKQLQGKELSFNNIADTDAALECVKSFSQPACVIVKHANPCGVAVADSLLAAYEKAYRTDPTSAFGGIIAFNRELDSDTAKAIVDCQFTEVIIAPSVSQGAIDIVASKKNLRLLSCGQLSCGLLPSAQPGSGYDFKRVNGGLLVQNRDLGSIGPGDIQIVTHRSPDEAEMKDLLFAWKVVKFVKSNAIVYAKNEHTVGIGAGQMSRLYSAIIANIKASDEGLEVKGSVMASDAFFPFQDSIDAAAKVGITAVIQPGGSIRDKDVIDAANSANIAMVFTGMRHFRH